MIRTLLADDHRLFCEGISKLLSESGHFNVIGQFHNGSKLLEEFEAHDPDLLLLDIEIPGMNGLEVLRRLRSKFPNVKIAMLSMHEQSVYSKESKLEGANAYFTKSIEGALLIEFLRRVMDGENMFPDTNPDSKSNTLLSKQERRILKLIAEGHTSTKIAAELNISSLTVKAHRRNMMRKLGVDNSAALISTAFAKGLL